MVRSKELIRFETDEKIRLDKVRAELDMKVAEHDAKLVKEIENLKHKNCMEELKILKEILPIIREILQLQKELGIKGSVTGMEERLNERGIEIFGRAIAKELLKVNGNQKRDRRKKNRQKQKEDEPSFIT